MRDPHSPQYMRGEYAYRALSAAKMDEHPLTGLPLREPGEWWFVEEKE